MTTAYQLIRTDAEGAELICGNGDLGAKLYSEHHVRDMVSILNRQHPEFKYSYREVAETGVNLNVYNRICLGFGHIFAPIVLAALSFKLVAMGFRLGIELVRWAVK